MGNRQSPLEGLAVNPNFWRGKRVFLTGHTGFKGSWLSLWLQSLGAEVTGFALPPATTPSLFHEARVSEGMRSVTGDVRDLTALMRAMQVAQPEIVLHLAAQSLVRHSYQDPVGTYATNVMGTVNTLESVRESPSVKAIVVVTSDKCYENREWLWGYRENEPMGGHDPYSSSKGCAELVTAAYRTSFFHAEGSAGRPVAVATARAGNVIGGGDWAMDRLVPDIISAFAQNKPILMRNPNAIRPWQHVMEPLRGYLSLAEHLVAQGVDFAEGWNFGPSEEDARPVEWLVQQMAQRWGGGAHWQFDAKQPLHEAGLLKLDISKAKNRLGWSPVIGLGAALDLVIEWAKQRQNGADARTLTQQQIATYQRLSA